jgi:hypothetical protein
MVSKRELEELRIRGARSQAEMMGTGSKARSAASKIYPGLTDPLTQTLVKANWADERKKPSRRFKRKPFRKRGEQE